MTNPVMERENRPKCPCYMACEDCAGFQKIIDLKNAGLVIYRHTDRTDEIDRNTGLLEARTKITDDVIIIHNTRDVQVKAIDCISEFDQQISCPRCKGLLEHAKKVFRNISSIDKKEIIGICDHCRFKEPYCHCEKCHKLIKKFITEKDKPSIDKNRLKAWLSKAQKLLDNIIADEINTKPPKGRAYSELNINNLQNDLRTPRKLEVEPIIDHRVRISESTRNIPKATTQLDSPLIILSSNTTQPKSVHIGRTESFSKVDKIISSSSSQVTFKTLLDVTNATNTELKIEDSLRQDSGRTLQWQEDIGTQEKEWRHSAKAFPSKPVKHPPGSLRTLKKHYSEEDLFITTADHEGHGLDEDFSFFFPKVTTEKRHLKRSKTSAELILDAREILNQRLQMERNKLDKDLKRRIIKQESKYIGGKKNIQGENAAEYYDKTELPKENKSQEDNKANEEIFSKSAKLKTKDVDQDITLIQNKHDIQKNKFEKQKIKEKDNDVIKIDKEAKRDVEKSKIDKQKIKEKSEKYGKGKDVVKVEKEAKRDLDKPKFDKQNIKEKSEKHEKDKQEKEEKQRQKEEKQREKQEQLKKEKEDKQRLKPHKEKDERDRKKEEKQKSAGPPHKRDEDLYATNMRKMLEEQAKEKAEQLKIKKQQEELNKKMKSEDDKKTKEEAEQKLKMLKELRNETKIEKRGSVSKAEKLREEPASKDLHIQQVKIRKPSPDDLILQLVKLKQSSEKDKRARPENLADINITPLIVEKHKDHKSRKVLNCAICADSEIELDVENILRDSIKSDKMSDIIVGNKILKTKTAFNEMSQAEEIIPILFQSMFRDDNVPIAKKDEVGNLKDLKEYKPLPFLSHKYAEQELPKGVIRYALSDRTFIDKGWTMLPTEKIVRKMNVYRMRPAHPEFDWFAHNKNKRLIQYDSGEKLAEFDDNGRGRWYYRNGRLALDYYDAQEMNAQQRFVIYSSGEPDERGRYQPITILATFDYLGNGVVFDHSGKIRLKYNQTEGIVLDRNIGPVSHWKWHTLNDPPVLQQIMIDTQMAHKDPDILKLGGPGEDKMRPDNEEMLAIEFDNFIKEKSKKLSQKFKPFQIRTKALKINENFSLRILDQANIYLIYRDGTTNLKMNIGMILDHQEIVDTDTAEVGEVSNNIERFPARTDSLAGLQQSVAHAQRVERLRVEREHRLRRPEPCASADQLVAVTSRPLRQHVHSVGSSSTAIKGNCYCKCRKPSICNVYYDTRLV